MTVTNQSSSELRCSGRLISAVGAFVSAILSTLCFALFAALASITLFLLAPLWLTSILLDREQKTVHRIFSRLLHSYLSVNPFWSCRFYGLENLRDAQPAVLVANHQSIVDIVALSGLPLDFKWIAKQAIFHIPIINMYMLIGRDVRLQSNTIKGTRKMMRECQRWLSKGISLIIFPEGTRSPDGEMLPFKDGPFHLAVKNNVPVTPLVVEGTRQMLPRRGRCLSLTGAIEIRVLPAVEPQQCGMDPKALSTHVRSLMAGALRQMRQERQRHTQRELPVLTGSLQSASVRSQVPLKQLTPPHESRQDHLHREARDPGPSS